MNFDTNSDTIVFNYFVVTEHYETAVDKKKGLANIFRNKSYDYKFLP